MEARVYVLASGETGFVIHLISQSHKTYNVK